MNRIRIQQGDITRMDVEAIVNAANSSLLGGGGVDGAIHQAAGPELGEFCATLGGCPTGEARLTPAFQLPQRYILHTVGPVWQDGEHGEADLLESCYRSVLALCRDHQIESVAFPSISTGAYGYPIEHAAPLALRTVARELGHSAHPRQVVFCAYSVGDTQVYHRAWRQFMREILG